MSKQSLFESNKQSSSPGDEVLDVKTELKQDLVKFGEEDFFRTNIGNEIHFECFVPENNDSEVTEGIVDGLSVLGLFDGIK